MRTLHPTPERVFRPPCRYGAAAAGTGREQARDMRAVRVYLAELS